MLGVVAMAGLRPWATSSVAPSLSVAPGIGVALGDSTAVARGGSPGVGTGGVAAPVASPVRVAAPVAAPAPKRPASQPVLAVSPAQPLPQASPPAPVASPPASSPAPAPVVAAPAPAPEGTPAPLLVASVDPGAPGTAGRPGTSVIGGGEPEQSCEGDEYAITVTFEAAEAEGEEVDYELAEADILISRLEADGSETEVHLQGNLTDVRSLVAMLVAEGNCVQVDVRPAPGTDSTEEVPGAGVEAAVPGDSVEAALP